MTGESTKDRLVRLETILGTLQPAFESLAKNAEIHSIEMVGVKQTCAEFVNEFSDKLNRVMEVVAASVDVLKGDIRDLAREVELLKRAAQTELRRQAVRDLPTAIVAADGLVDFRFADHSPSESKKSKENKKASSSYDGGKKNKDQGKTKQGNPQVKKSSGCFICEGPHRAKECPKHEKLNALVKESEGEALKPSEAEVSAEHMNLLQLLSNTEVKVEQDPIEWEVLESIFRGEFYQGGLMCVRVELNGVEIEAMINTGSTANLVEASLVPRLGLQVDKANIVMSFTSHYQVVPEGLATTNLSVGT